MRTKIIQIGNSKGIRIPKTYLDESGCTDEVELQVKEKQIVIQPIEKPRSNWNNSFREMASHSEDELLDKKDSIRLSEWDESEWKW